MAQRDLVDELLQAMDIITQNHLKNLSFDLTKVCTIVDDKDSKNGYYIVTDGTIRFDAYSESSDYKKDDQVRVSIPNGDYTQKKYIEGKEVTDNNSAPITYISPLETILDMSDNLMKLTNTWSLSANNKRDVAQLDEIAIWAINMQNSKYKDLQNNGIYDTISLKADFRTLLSHYQMRTGNYGLKLVATLSNGTKTIYLDSSQMFGNPFSFSVFSTQEMKVDIANLGTIKQLQLFFYQKKNFTYYDQSGKEAIVLVNKDSAGNCIDNIFVKNIEIKFGAELIKVDDNTLKLFTPDSMTFEYRENPQETETRDLSILWYNKDSEGRYVGFSDGVYDPEYDELTYLATERQNKRLSEQQGEEIPVDEMGFNLAADMDDIGPAVEAIDKTVCKNLKSQVEAFWRAIGEIAPESSELGKKFTGLVSGDSSDNSLLYQASILLPENKAALVNFYEDCLQQAWLKFVQEKEYTTPDVNKGINLHNGIVGMYTNIQDYAIELLNQAKQIIETNHRGFLNKYDAYSDRINRVLEQLKKQIKVYEEATKNITALTAYFNSGYVYQPYTLVDLSQWDNRYSIYWYRYVPGYSNEEETLMPAEWQKIELDKLNYGLPEEDEENPGYYSKKPSTDISLTVDILLKNTVEKFAVVLFYDHTMYKSSELEFKNINPPISDDILQLYGSTFIEHDPSTQSRDSYQIYDVNNSLVNMADASRKRRLRLRFMDVGQESIEDLTDASLANAQIFWYIPNDATMLKYNLQDLEDFSNDTAGAHSTDYRPGYTCFYRTIRANENGIGEESTKIISEDRYFTYAIKDYYVPAHTNNTIYCVIKKNLASVFEAEISFTFSSYGTSGTDYSLVVAPTGLRTTANQSETLTLGATLYDYNNAKQKIVTTSSYSYGEVTLEDVKWIGAKRKDFSADTKVNVSDDVVIMNVDNDNLNLEDHYNVLQVDVKLSPDEAGSRKQDIVLSTVYPVAYSTGAEGQYFAEGASYIVYDASGTNPSYYKGPYRLFSRDTGEEVSGTSWRLEHYYYETPTSTGTKFLTDVDGKNIVPPLLLSFTPTLDKDNCLVPANMYINGTEDNNSMVYTVAKCYVGDVLYWAQPIHIMQNRYPSPMLNSWDGSLTIDEKNGTILSSMVGAGKKNAQNQFEGVLMGDVIGSAEDDASGIGLFGYNAGAQSFAFNVDGTAHIGKSGRGRIYFDGNSGTITSASWEQYKIDNNVQVFSSGMKIDLDDGWLEIRGTSKKNNIYSPYTNSSIRLDAIAPYFKIKSAAGNPLVFIGDAIPILADGNGYAILDSSGQYQPTNDYNSATQGFYLQSDDYEKDARGMKIDLGKGGRIEAHNFSLTTSYLTMNSQGSQAYPYLSIKNTSNKQLFHISNDGFLINSPDDVLIISSGMNSNPYLLIQKNPGNNAKVLMKVTGSEFVIRSDNFTNTGTDISTYRGLEFNVANGSMSAYSGFTLIAYQLNGLIGGLDKDKFIVIDTQATSIPFQIGQNLTIDWEGNLTAKNGTGTFKDIKITNGEIDINDGVFKVDKDGNVTASSLTIPNGGTLTVSGKANFGSNAQITGNVDITGTITASKGTIGGWVLGTSSISKGQVVLDGSSGDITGGGGKFFVSGTTGKLTGEDAELTNLTVHGKLTIKTTGKLLVNVASSIYDVSVKGESYLRGNVGIGTTPQEKYAVCIGGRTKISGETEVTKTIKITGNAGIGGIDPDDTYSLKTKGDLYVGSEVYIENTKHIRNVSGTSNIRFDANGLFFYGSGIYMRPDTQFEIPAHTVVNTTGNSIMSLADYIAEQSGFTLVKVEGSNASVIATGSHGLYNGDGVKTVSAPFSGGSEGQYLKKGADGTSVWADINASVSFEYGSDAFTDFTKSTSGSTATYVLNTPSVSTTNYSGATYGIYTNDTSGAYSIRTVYGDNTGYTRVGTSSKYLYYTNGTKYVTPSDITVTITLS